MTPRRRTRLAGGPPSRAVSPSRPTPLGVAVRRALIEGLEGRRLFCLQHVIGGPTVDAFQGADVLGPVAAQSGHLAGEGALPQQPPGPVTTSLTNTSAAAVPGQVNGGSIFGGGLYGSAAANFTARADGLPILKSKPGAAFTVFLDFDGWSGNGYSGTENWSAYDTDGNSASFGATEESAIAEGWRRIATFFSQFDVNVSTVQPTGTAKNFSWSIISPGVTGGYSYLQLGGTKPSAFNQASDLLTRTSGILHEIGHNFSLQHQSLFDAAGTNTAEYRGQIDAIHGVIMGVDYSGTPPKWIYGHPSPSATAAQDDVAVIASKVKAFSGGDGFRADDYGNSSSAATVLPTTTGSVQSAFGVVERLSDIDAFSFTSAGGRYTLNLTPDSPSSLDGKLQVLDGSGNTLALVDDPTKIDATVTLDLPAGTYTALVKSHGNYDDQGPYEIKVAPATGAVIPPAVNGLPAPIGVATTLAAGTGITVSWSLVAGATGYKVERSADGVNFATANAAVPGTSYTDASLAGSARYVYRVRANNALGASVASDPSAIANRPSAVTGLRYTALASSPTALTLDWLELPSSSGETGYRVERSADGATFTTVGTVGPNVVIFTNTGLTAGVGYLYRVIPTSALGDGPASATLQYGTLANRAPVAVDDAVTTTEDTSVTFGVLANDTDPDGDALYGSALSNPAHGRVVRENDQRLTYTPDPDYNGPDQFTYSVTDLKGHYTTATVRVTVTPVNDNPVAVADAADATAGVPVAIAVLANDTDVDGDALSVSAAGPAGHGTVAVNPDGTVSYTAAADYVGTDAFDYTVSDGNGGSATATVSVAVAAGNRKPVAADDAAATAYGTPVTVAVLANDSDADGDALSVAAVGRPANGSAAVNADGTITYTPTAGFSGVDAFAYDATDGHGGSATATVTVTVAPGNRAPTAGYDSATTAEDAPVTLDVLANDGDPDGDVLAVTAVGPAAHGSVVFTANGAVTYTPAPDYNGPDGFTYTIADGRGGSATGTVDLIVTPVNDPPTLAQAAKASATTVTSATVNLTALGADPDGESTLKYTWAKSAGPANAVAFSANGTNAAKATTATFTAAGTYTFKVTIADPAGATVTSSVTVTVNRALKAVKLTPATAAVKPKGTAQFAAKAYDQFDVALATQPKFAWAIGAGGGTVTSAGLFTAGATAGSATVRATALTSAGASTGVAGTATVTVTAAAIVPTAPTNLVAAKGANRTVKLTWKDNATTETGFYVQTSTNGSMWTNVYTRAASTGSGTTLTYTTGSYAAGTRYFRVRAFNDVGTSNPSNLVTVAL